MRKVFIVTGNGTYYVERHFAWFPMYCQGTFVWLWFAYCTYLDRGKGREYEVWFPSDPSDGEEE